MIRVTTNGTLRNYRSSLMRSSKGLNSARDTVLSQRNFNSYAEDPAAATQAFKLRRAFSRTSDQITNNTAVTKKYQSAWNVLDAVKNDLTEAEGKVSALSGITDTAGGGRQPLGSVLVNAAESIIQSMNSKYGSAYIFGGNDSLGDAPFTTAGGADGSIEVLYRGLKVSDPANQEALDIMNAERAYVDVGSGLTEVDGKLVESTAFNTALSGIEYLGYGVDEDGDPKNVAEVLYKLGSIFSRCDAQSGAYASAADEETAERLATKVQDALDGLVNKWAQMDTKSAYLKTNANRLNTMSDELNEQILDIEQVDLADAITEFSWAQYCYNAALKVGNSILSQSLLDYMN